MPEAATQRPERLDLASASMTADRIADLQSDDERDGITFGKGTREAFGIVVSPPGETTIGPDASRQTVSDLKPLGIERFRVLITMVPSQPDRAEDEARTMLTGAGLPVFADHIGHLVAFQGTALAGLAVVESTDPRAREGW